MLQPSGSGAAGPQPPAFRAQDGKPLLPPPNIAFLWENGNEIPPHREAEALLAWQGARKRAAATDIGAGEEVSMLTRALASKAEEAGDFARVRALIEAGLECAPLPRQRAVLLGAMARASVRAGDVESARAWLACFEPPQDLEADSEYRITIAVVATARGDFGGVLSAIGSTFGELAIQDALDPMAIIFRVNALERLGRSQEATQQLNQLMSAGAGARTIVERIQKQYQRLNLCQATLPAVMSAHEQQARASAGSGGILMGAILIGVSLLPFLITSVIAITETISSRGKFSLHSFVPVPFTLIFVLAFGSWGWRTLRQGLRERRVFAEGIRTQARVVSARPTGVRINDIPEMQIELVAQLPQPVQTRIRLVVDPGQQHMLTPGTMVFIRLDPSQPDVAVLEQ